MWGYVGRIGHRSGVAGAIWAVRTEASVDQNRGDEAIVMPIAGTTPFTHCEVPSG